MRKKTSKSNEKVKKIKNLLAIEDIPENISDAISFNKKVVIESLLSLGAKTAEVQYDGSGDSGQIEGIEVFDSKNKPLSQLISKQSVPFYRVRSEYGEKNGWSTKFEKIQMPLDDALSQIAEDLLDYSQIDWYNNDGGYGRVVFDIKRNKMKLEHNQRVMSEDYEEREF